MQSQNLPQGMYGLHDRSIAQRLTLAALSGVWIAVAWWLLFGGGLATTGHWFGLVWTPGGTLRRALIAGSLSVYYLRLLFTEFVFLRRGVSWNEVFQVAPWILCICLLLAIPGGTNPEPLGPVAYTGVVLFLAGSWMNSYAEYARHVWKQRPENHGRLYTEGLFRHLRHPNYLGDLLSFSGLCLIAGAWITAAIPVIMLAGFVFFNIPVLDSHLRDHYGVMFDQYAKRTWKLIPFVY